MENIVFVHYFSKLLVDLQSFDKQTKKKLNYALVKNITEQT